MLHLIWKHSLYYSTIVHLVVEGIAIAIALAIWWGMMPPVPMT
jgi:hypothetical protein